MSGLRQEGHGNLLLHSLAAANAQGSSGHEQLAEGFTQLFCISAALSLLGLAAALAMPDRLLRGRT
jgi:hypothetical protein